MATRPTWGSDSARGAERPRDVFESVEALTKQLWVSLRREADWESYGHHGGMEVVQEEGLVVGSICAPEDVWEVLPRVAKAIQVESAASGMLLFPKIPAAMFLPDQLVGGLIALRISVEYAIRKDLRREARRLLAQHVTRLHELAANG
jgi:hypothetical protein